LDSNLGRSFTVIREVHYPTK